VPGSITTDASGAFSATLDTTGVGAGTYTVTAFAGGRRSSLVLVITVAPVTVKITSYSCQYSHRNSSGIYYRITIDGEASGPAGASLRITKSWRDVASGTIPGADITGGWTPTDVPEQGTIVRGGARVNQTGGYSSIQWSVSHLLEYYNPPTGTTRQPGATATVFAEDGSFLGREETGVTFKCW
jgi:hypothetical protein